jgi:carboxymethylenebutenolidase
MQPAGGEEGEMCDQDHFENDRREFEARGLVTRKQFGVLLGAGVAMMLPPVANAIAVTESEISVTTPDGTADCYFVHPASGTAPGVLIWPDIFGLRPAFRQMGKRLAESGYSVLVVNPFYRTKKAPTAESGAATSIQQLMPLARSLNETTQMSDAKAFIGWLDKQSSVAKNRKMGTQGYCMGGPIAFRTAAAVPDRVGAVASFHGGGLVTDAPNSPHLQAAKTHAQFLILIADNDDKRSPNDKSVLKETFAKANLPAEIEVYAGAAHGWCPPDSQVYNEASAEKTWGRLIALYGKALA